MKNLENKNDKFQENLSRPGIIDARARYRAATLRLRNTDVEGKKVTQTLYRPEHDLRVSAR